MASIRSLLQRSIQEHPCYYVLLYVICYMNTGNVSLVKPVDKGLKIDRRMWNMLEIKKHKKSQLRLPLQQIYDPCEGPEDLMQIYIIVPFSTSNRFTHILTVVDVF